MRGAKKTLAALIVAVSAMAGCGSATERMIAAHPWKIAAYRDTCPGNERREEAPELVGHIVTFRADGTMDEDYSDGAAGIFADTVRWRVDGRSLVLYGTGRAGKTGEVRYDIEKLSATGFSLRGEFQGVDQPIEIDDGGDMVYLPATSRTCHTIIELVKP